MHSAALLLGVVGLATILATTLQDSSAEFVWLDDLDAARAVAEKENKPLLLAFR